MNAVLNQLFSVSFFEKAVAFSLPDTLLILLVSALLGLFIAALYKATYQGVMYTMTYGVALAAITMISALILCVVTSNVVLTLGSMQNKVVVARWAIRSVENVALENDSTPEH